ncbi:CoA-transferase family III [Sanguibacter gelidistatuariae]|uniref:CoA-transferase family III n=1 Tax=Sanguibacter gelidistatuariae TaxID=1814289 RepID=A0A1G6N4E4_9MICO|nr:CoA transferase [Sanguibacter gelidistatuariae]SDC62571.1 CoA-transferase family III [Sanguibacter gelidistatuariae]
MTLTGESETTMTAPSHKEPSTIDRMLDEIVGNDRSVEVAVTGRGSLPSVFGVSDLATASVAAAGVAVSELLALDGAAPRPVRVDRRLASMWFASSLRPDGWEPPPPWDAVAGDYRATDGWIRLHTNAPAHREAALAVLDVPADRGRVAAAVATWQVDRLETVVVAAGGCAAAMHTLDEWEAGEPGRSVATEPLIAWEDTGPAPAASWSLDPARPLAGVRVLDLTRVLAGPVATRFLAQLGADVLRIDPPWWEEPGVVPDVILGKRSARLDLREPADRDRLLELLAGADMLVHGYRPGALDGRGLGEAARRDVRPGLIEVSLDAYGWTGPWASRRGFDSLVQMSTGIAEAGMRLLGRDKPTPLPVQALDHATGYLMAHAAIRALAGRLRTGRGSSAALSLARTAGLLTQNGTSELGPPIRSEDEHDIARAFEHTSWGPARRLRAPVAIDGVDFRAHLPARDLGSDTAAW